MHRTYDRINYQASIFLYSEVTHSRLRREWGTRAMSADKDSLARPYYWFNCAVPVEKTSFISILQTFSCGELIFVQGVVLRIKSRMPFIMRIQSWRPIIVTSSPSKDLIISGIVYGKNQNPEPSAKNLVVGTKED